MGCASSTLHVDPAADPKKVPVPQVKPKPPAAETTNDNVLPAIYQGDVTALYNLGKVLGKGQFGTTRLAVSKETGEKFACKTISKRKLVKPLDRGDVQREVKVMNHLTGHPNIVRFVNAYEDKRNVHIVMELCSGGELFDRIVKRGHYSEKHAAYIIRSIVTVVAHCHSEGVIHRDLKPENFLLQDDAPTSELKATDFGLSVFFKPGEMFEDIVGSAYYVAPEVLKKEYSSQCDIWSCGIMLYILLCGVPPFFGETEAAIFRAVIKGKIDFDTPPWPRVSAEAKDCVKRMLEKDVKKRATAEQILRHEWLMENGCANDQPLENEIQTRLKKFQAMNNLKRHALKLVASYMHPDEVAGLKNQFEMLDKDGSGTITVEELCQSMQSNGKVPVAEVMALINQLDLDESGAVDYQEFLAATLHASKANREEHLQRAFATFDTDNSGTITREELVQAYASLGEGHTKDDIDDVLREVDKDGDGKIDYQEFLQMMAPPTTDEPVRRRMKIKF